MIKFFKKIRQKLLSENKFSKYLFYAIGEIILVVIGILIALGINNLNDDKKNDIRLEQIFSIILTDLKSDINDINTILKKEEFRDSITSKILKRNITEYDYKNCNDCSVLLFGFEDLELRRKGAKLLNDISFAEDTSDSLTSAIEDFYSKYTTELNVALKEVEMDYKDNYNYFKNNASWFTELIIFREKDEFIKYALESNDYRNRITSFYLLYSKIYLKHLKNYKVEAMSLIDKIGHNKK